MTRFAVLATLLALSTALCRAQHILQGQAHPLAQSRWDRGAVPPDMDLPYLTMHFRSTPERQAALEKLLEDQRDASSPNYHRWLTPEEFGDHFGLSDADLAAVSDWLRAQGFRVHGAARGRRWIAFGGNARQIAQAFGAEIHQYEVDGRLHYANASAPRIPAAFKDLVQGVHGLDDFEPEPAGHRGPSVPQPLFTNGTGAHFLAPEDIATIYNFTPLYSAGLDGSGQRIAIGGRTLLDLADYQAFRRRFNLPAADPTLLVVPGSDPGTGVPADIEESNIDLQWARASAPKAAITLVYARSTYTAAQYAIDQHIAPVLSLSYGQCEANAPSSTVAFLRGAAQQASAQGITWVASTGDVGAAGCERQDILTVATRGLAVQIPAAIPEITAVGGTELDDAGGSYWNSKVTANGGSALSYIPEKGWNDSQLLFGLASSGGGMSTLFSKPAWQSGPGVPAPDVRMVPDLSLAASWNHDGWLTYVNGSSGAYGGTSVAAPVFAGVLAILNQALTSRGLLKQPGLGNVNPALYRMAQTTPEAFHDIVNGDNIVPCGQGSPDCVNGSFGYRAGPGYDLVTGLGSLDVATFVNKWSTAPATATSVIADPPSVVFDGSLTLTATVAGSGSPAGSVNFLSRDTVLGSAVLNGGSASLTIGALKLPAGTTNITAVYAGSNQFTGSSGITPVTVTLPAAGSAVVPSLSPDPVYRQPPDTNGYSWFLTITLSERAGVATTLTGLQMLGRDYSSQIVSLFRQAAIPARGSISASIGFSIADPPATREFSFTGADADGRTWTEKITAAFLATRAQTPWVTVTTTPGTADPQASTDPGCQFQDRVTLQENGGYLVDLSKLTAGPNDLSTQISQIFGTTHVAPYGALFGSICWSAQPAPGTRYTFTGSTESGITVVASANATPSAAAAAPSAFTASQPSISLSVPDSSGSSAAVVDLGFGGASAKWSIAINPANTTANWLKVSPLSGAGAARIAITASAAGLSNGAYTAVLTIQAQGALPQYITLPVMFVVGAGGGVQIGGAANGASYKVAFAPGMLVYLAGSNLAPGIEAAIRVPLPISMQGVSATVNGIAAPLYYVSPGQIDLQIPYETSAGPAAIGINNNGRVAGFFVNIAPSAPGIFTAANSALVPYNSGKRGAILLAFITGEGDISPPLFTGRAPSGGTPVARLPKPLLPVTVTVGGVNADVAFAGIPPGLSGVTQINFTIPATAPLGDQPVVVTVGGVPSLPARLTVTP